MIAVTGLVAASAFTSNAQVEKGSLMLGGNFGANVTMESTTKLSLPGIPDVKKEGHTNWNFSPKVGYFVANGLAVGLTLNVNSTFQSIATNGAASEHLMRSGMGAGLFARKYIAIAGTSLFFHGQAELMYNSSSFTDRIDDGPNKLKDGDKVTFSSIGITITPGLTYFVSPKWGIDFSLNNILGYTSTTTKIETPANGNIPAFNAETSGGSFNIGAGLIPSLGLFYYLGK